MSEGFDPELQALTTVEGAWGPRRSRKEGSGNSVLAQLRHMKRPFIARLHLPHPDPHQARQP